MKHLWISLITVFTTVSVFAQDSDNDANAEKAYTPTIGIGVGTIGFYGDLNDKEYGTPFGANPGYSVFILQPISDYFNVKFNFFSGEVREEERSLQRNVNFETDLVSGALMMEYNFAHLLPEQRKITPFLTAGVEVVEFNPKTDLLAQGGEPYNYWTDGTIRNIPENSANADQSVIIQRDYTYETDIREAGYNRSTTYSERALSIPVGVGFNLHLNDQFGFRFESVMHLTFSDYIDGLTTRTRSEFIGGKKANANKDYFLVSGISLTYNFQKVAPADPYRREGEEENFDFLAYGNTEDFDNDGIIDLIDKCPDTPPDVEVDTSGCPIDTDGDGVPDYIDEEVDSKYPMFANDKGVSMTDEMIYESYMRYKDSTLEFAEVIERDFRGDKKEYKKYRVRLGEYNKGETPENMNELLSISDLKKVDQGDKSIYTVGNYKSLAEAKQRVQSLKESGFEADVVKRSPSGTISDISTVENEILAETKALAKTNNEKIAKETGVAFRVQLGAFRKKPTTKLFNSIPDLIVIESDGIYKYMSGSFQDFNSAAKHKVKMVVQGYEGAFVVAYKDGKRVKLRTVGVKPITSDPLIGQ